MLKHATFVLGTLMILTVQAAGQLAEPEDNQEPAKAVEPEKDTEKPPLTPKPAEENDEEVQALERAILAKWDKVRSLSAKMTMNDRIRREDNAEEWKGEGTYDCMRKGDKMLVRVEVASRLAQTPENEVADATRKVLTISDGEVSYSLVEVSGGAHAFKIDADRSWGVEMGGPRVFDNLRRSATLKVLPDDTVNGRPAYVIQGIPRQGAPKRVFSFDKKFGVVIKMVTEDPFGQRMQTISLADLKLNPEFGDDHFVFKAPEGVEVRDMTRPKREEAGGDAPAPPPPP